ncbi:MAG: hypothetical protein AAF441_13485 [Pseudomonadota bacterium]
MRVWLAIVFLFLSTASVPAASTNFSQYPGFAEWYAANPPSSTLPSDDDQALLQKHRPRFFLGEGQTGFIDFYRDYIAHGTLRTGSGDVISSAVTPEVLNAQKDNPTVEFTHRPQPGHTPAPAIYARISRNTVDWLGEERELTFLNYTAVFAHSGLTTGLLGWQKLALGLIGNLQDWHQLDHYTAATLILEDGARPFALMLQQHNYLRTYLIGESVTLPDDGRPLVAVAKGSNELFPYTEGRTSHRAVPFLTPPNFRYMAGSGPRPFLTADDITEPEVELVYRLAFLPPSDAFYTFKGYLGARRMLPGRDGPPGADYNTLPDLKPLPIQMLSGYWRFGHESDIGRLEAALLQERYWLEFARGQATVFYRNAACARAWGKDCAFE